MNKLLAFIRLDFITIKPYLTIKNLFILLLVIIALSINNTVGGILIGIVMMFALLYAAYPFAVGEKNGIDQLYSTLPVSRRSIVLGRYGFVVALVAVGGIASCILLFIWQTVLQRAFNLQEALLTTLALFAIYTFFQAIQLPIYFKLGYAKAKFLAYLPFALFPLTTIAIGSRFTDADWIGLLETVVIWIVNHQLFAVVIGVVSWLAMMAISCLLSLRFYKKREF